MIRSMLSAVSGLRNHQSLMDVIGNNIANVNTVGFKGSRMLFADMLSQLGRSASAPTATRGGTNPLQVGLGMQVAGADTIHTQGNLQSTGKITDLAIEGDGFFILNDGTRNVFTRDGSFDIAVDGTIVSPSTGLKVQGWMANATGQVDTTQPLGSITIPFGSTMAGQPSTAITVRGNLDATTPVTGPNNYGPVTQSNALGGPGTLSGTYTGNTAANYVVRIASTDAPTGEVTGIQVSMDGGITFGSTIATSGGLPVSIGNGVSIALATDIDNAVGDTYSFDAAPPVETTVAIYDSLGSVHNVKITFRKTGVNTWSWVPSTTEAGVTITPTTPTNFSFSSTGGYTGLDPAGTIQLTLSNGAANPTLDLDLSKLTQLAGASEVQTATDGAPAGSLVSFSIGRSGDVTGVYTNGLSKLIGQIALAKFPNPGGLLKAGANLYEMSSNSGEPATGVAGVGGRGEISSGYLEMSNVDLALQFTNMIMAERGFQANSRIISASDEMLQDLVNLKR